MLILVSFFFDNQLLKFITENRNFGESWDQFFIWVSDYWIFFGAAFLGIIQIYRKNWSKLFQLGVTIFLVIEICILLKKFFAIPRPFFEISGLNLILVDNYSFPSSHAAIAFCLAYFLFSKKNWLISFGALLFALTIAISRLYLGVHRFSEVLAGAFLGIFLAKIIYYYFQKYKIWESILNLLRQNLEFRRQLLHLLVTAGLAYMVLFKILNFWSLGIILICGILLSFFSRKGEIPLISKILHIFEREKNLKSFPGKGVIFLFMGALITLILFSHKIAFLALLLTAVGDALSPLFGIMIGKKKLPWNKAKHFEGLFFSIFVTTLFMWHFLPFLQSLALCTLALLLESFSLKILNREVDDNLLLPIFSGAIIYFLF